MIIHARSWLLASISLIAACGGSTPEPEPDASFEPDAAVDCPSAAFAASLVGQHFQQQTPGDPSVSRSSCRLYRADVSIDSFVERDCSLGGWFGWTGIDAAGVTSVGGHGFLCSLAGANEIDCFGDTIGTAGASLVNMRFTASEGGATMITMYTETDECADEAEVVPAEP